MNHCTEVRFASFLSGGFTAIAVLNPPESNLPKRTSVHSERLLVMSTFCVFLHPMDNAQCTKVRFARFLSGGFITAIVVNPPERKLAKHISVQCSEDN